MNIYIYESRLIPNYELENNILIVCLLNDHSRKNSNSDKEFGPTKNLFIW